MTASTGIEWCDATFNPWWGCERVSPACAHCYADTFARRIGRADLWSKRGDHAFRFFGDKHWAEPLRWAALARDGLLPDRSENPDGHRPRIFCASMADVFEEHDDLVEHRCRLFELIDATPELDWLVLTKRPEAARDFYSDWRDYTPLLGRPLANVWLGVSIENTAYTWRADVLREIPAAVRFISAEPLLASLYPKRTTGRPLTVTDGELRPSVPRGNLNLAGIHWVIIGGESGPRSRPFELEHAREVIRACRSTVSVSRFHEEGQFQVAVFVKQLGAKPVVGRVLGKPGQAIPLRLRDRKGGDLEEWPAEFRVREFPRSAVAA